MDDCIFCKIASGDIPSSIVYSDDKVIAFDDLNPQAPVHTLVIPRDHYGSVADDVPDDVLAAVLKGAVAVAALKGIDKTGFRLIMNTGKDAGQTVPHFHVHVLGGIQMKEGMLP